MTLAHLACQDVFLVTVIKNNANVMMALKWLDSVRVSIVSQKHTTRMHCLPLPEQYQDSLNHSLAILRTLSQCAARAALYTLLQESKGEANP